MLAMCCITCVFDKEMKCKTCAKMFDLLMEDAESLKVAPEQVGMDEDSKAEEATAPPQEVIVK